MTTRKTARRQKTTARRKTAASGGSAHRWSADVMRKSDALDLENGVFKLGSARKIAASLKHSAEASHRRKGTPYQSAMSMLTFYINRAGRDLPATRKHTLERAKSELRKAFGRED